MIFTREWAMPSPDTFSIPPIALLLRKWLLDRKCIIDPFARNSRLAHHRNDLNPETLAESHLDAVSFLSGLHVEADCLLFDPPYSPRQISEVYQGVGRKCSMKETQSAVLYMNVRDAADRILLPESIVISCGWNTAGMGTGRNYDLLEVLIVPHGGAHNDTLVTVERKRINKQGGLGL